MITKYARNNDIANDFAEEMQKRLSKLAAEPSAKVMHNKEQDDNGRSSSFKEKLPNSAYNPFEEKHLTPLSEQVGDDEERFTNPNKVYQSEFRGTELDNEDLRNMSIHNHKGVTEEDKVYNMIDEMKEKLDSPIAEVRELAFEQMSSLLKFLQKLTSKSNLAEEEDSFEGMPLSFSRKELPSLPGSEKPLDK